MSSEELFLQGYKYYCEAGCPEDLQKAVALLGEASAMGNPAAQDVLGNMYEDGDGVDQDYAVAAELYRQSSEQRYPAGMHDYGVLLLYGCGVHEDQEMGFRLIHEAVELSDDPDFIFTESVCYLNGLGVDKDESKAVSLLRKAAGKGSVRAKSNLGALMMEKDPEEAFGLLKEASEDQDPGAMCNLGLMYEMGLYVETDIKAAESYYRQATEMGHAPAYYHLAMLAVDGHIDLKDADPMGLLEEAGENGCGESFLSLGVLYYDGNGVDQDMEIAANYFRAGSEAGNPDCKYNLAVMILKGQAREEYLDEYVDLISDAADMGFEPAVKFINDCLGDDGA